MAHRRILLSAFLSALLASSLGGCGSEEGTPLSVAVIDGAKALESVALPLSAAAQLRRAATAQGLVSLDAKGEVVPALADRWIVTDDGRHFIFRLQNGHWPDGKPYTAESVAKALRRVIRDLQGTSLALDLAPVAQIRPMAGRVIEIRLTTPVPLFLQLLAQPELAFHNHAVQPRPSDADSGAMVMERHGEGYNFSLKPPADRGVPADEQWQKYVRPVWLQPMSAAEATDRFRSAKVDLVLGGTLGSLPQVHQALLSRGTLVYDPAVGLFGLQVLHADGFLAEPALRETLAMALDRPALMAPFNLPAWQNTTRVVQPGMPEDRGLIGERWAAMTAGDRQAEAKARVARWLQQNAPSAQSVFLRVRLSDTPGEDALLASLQGQLGPVGIALVAAPPGAPADLELVDTVARYASSRWFLNQFHCSLKRGLCSAEADEEAAKALLAIDAAERDAHLAQAEAQLARANVYIPFGAPVRWSLVRGTVAGYAPNPWGFHPLPMLASLPR